MAVSNLHMLWGFRLLGDSKLLDNQSRVRLVSGPMSAGIDSRPRDLLRISGIEDD